jgi:hypothetical protein
LRAAFHVCPHYSSLLLRLLHNTLQVVAG